MIHNTSLALLGGTFNPPHKGHIGPALEAIKEIGVSRLGLMPCKLPPHKCVGGIDEKHRVNMVQAVCKQSALLYPELIELSLPSPSYTVQTLRELRRQHPKATVYFLIGYDSLYNLPSWHEWQQLTDYCHLTVMRRTDGNVALSAELTAFIDARREYEPDIMSGKPGGSIYFADTTLHTVSSTALREAIAGTTRNETASLAKEWLEPDVIDYIYKHQLYQITE
ncbi:nicotinate (nicotinamide) nucleotide adenylyltransferase [Alteromonas antoniana]|uniref:nicotinate (nicotinamide) nucleotide adenylyltransferase n=1 Tax=Alteromonas antoniana TaxID=2803813 RepID=UPI001C45A31D|nr:nicotinate (nicotinamide) nucleotide adenylyltransferase [Alteromonas antoniana]